MKIQLTDFIKKASREISLSEAERSRMEGMLREYVAMKPIRGLSDARSRASTFLPLPVFAFFTRHLMPIALVVAILLTGSVSYAAEGALPGDFLYPVKVNVNEKVATTLATTPQAKASVEASLAEKRLEEATRLVSENKLTSTTSAELAANFSTHADAAVADTQKVNQNDAPAAATLASNFQADLSAHADILAMLGSDGSANTLLDTIRAKTGAVASARAVAEADSDVDERGGNGVAIQATAATAPMAARTNGAATFAASASKTSSSSASASIQGSASSKSAADQMKASAKAAISDTQDLFAKLSGKLSDDSSAAVSSNLDASAKFIATGDELYANGDFSGAFHAYQDAFATAKKLSVYLNAAAADSTIAIPVFFSARSGTDASDANPLPSSNRDQSDDTGSAPHLSTSTLPYQLEGSGSDGIE